MKPTESFSDFVDLFLQNVMRKANHLGAAEALLRELIWEGTKQINWTIPIDLGKPRMQILLDVKPFRGLIDTGADVTLLRMEDGSRSKVQGVAGATKYTSGKTSCGMERPKWKPKSYSSIVS